jgi:hypothetical protein
MNKTFQKFYDEQVLELKKYLGESEFSKLSNEQIHKIIKDSFAAEFPGEDLDKYEVTSSYTNFLKTWESKRPRGSGKKSAKSTDEAASGDIQFYSKGSRVKVLQTHIAQDNDYRALLEKGSKKYRSAALETWADPTDGLFGSRTDDAIRAFLELETSLTKDAQAPITPEMEKAILETKPDSNGNFKGTQDLLGAFARNDANNLNKNNAIGESVSYKKDLLSPTKNRHKEVEKLVFERLVKGCK